MKLGKFRKGQMAIVMTLAIATLLGVMALCTDVGVMYWTHMRLQKGADASALAGASYLDDSSTGVTYPASLVNASCTGEPDDAQKAACTYAINNGLAVDASSLTMNEPGSNLPTGTPTPNLQVIVNKSGLPFMFGRVLGLTTYSVAAAATAADPVTTGVGPGLFPMGMECPSPCTASNLVSGQSVPFDVKFAAIQGASAPGNWQWLDNGQGANGLAGAITGGMTGSYCISGSTDCSAADSVINSEPGNKSNSGPEKKAWNDRFTTNNCGSYDPCTNGGALNGIVNNPCLVTVPEVSYQGCTGNCTMSIEGFAQIWIEPGSTTSNISACYIQAPSSISIAGSGTQTDLGTTIIRLYQ